MTRTKEAEKAVVKPLARLGNAKKSIGRVSEATIASSRAYIAGLTELGRALTGFGRESTNDLGSHAKAILGARSVKDLVELQAGWIQHRAEATAAQTKEFADLARDKTAQVIAPLSALARKIEEKAA